MVGIEFGSNPKFRSFGDPNLDLWLEPNTKAVISLDNSLNTWFLSPKDINLNGLIIY